MLSAVLFRPLNTPKARLQDMSAFAIVKVVIYVRNLFHPPTRSTNHLKYTPQNIYVVHSCACE